MGVTEPEHYLSCVEPNKVDDDSPRVCKETAIDFYQVPNALPEMWFSIHPEKHQPSGTVNVSRVQDFYITRRFEEHTPQPEPGFWRRVWNRIKNAWKRFKGAFRNAFGRRRPVYIAEMDDDCQRPVHQHETDVEVL